MSAGRRLVAVVRFLLVELLREQRVLIPALLFLAAVGVLVVGDHTAAPGPWTGSVLLLYPTTAWIGLTAANAEDPAQRTVTVAAAGGLGVVAVATLLAALVLSLTLVAVGVLLPALVNPAGFPGSSVAAAALAHLAVACTGLALGTVCARPLVTRIGWSFVVVTVIVLLTIGTTWLPPVGVAAETLSSTGPTQATSAVLGLGGVALLAAGLLTLAGIASWVAARRT